MFTIWLTAQFQPHAPLFWLFIAAAASAAVHLLTRSLSTPWRRIFWLGHWLVIPYLGLLFGGLSPRLMGLAYIDWQISLSLGFGLIFAVLALLLLVRAAVELAAPLPSAPPVQPIRWEEMATGQPIGASMTWATVGGVTLLAAIREFHWAFLRGGLWEVLLSLPNPPELPAYWAIWIAASVAIAEILLRRLDFARTLFQVVILITTSILFFYTVNFWLCWILHAAAQLLFAAHAPVSLLQLLPQSKKRR
jgi:hypothetical protein